MTYIPMINAEGEIDMLQVGIKANIRAAREYGSPNFPPKCLREATDWCLERAASERLQWRQWRGLPSEEPTVQFNSYAPGTNE